MGQWKKNSLSKKKTQPTRQTETPNPKHSKSPSNIFPLVRKKKAVLVLSIAKGCERSVSRSSQGTDNKGVLLWGHQDFDQSEITLGVLVPQTT